MAKIRTDARHLPHRFGWLTEEYRLTKRVSLAATVGWTVTAALAFGVCGLLRVSPATYLLILAWGVAAGVVQWYYPRAPRIGSALAGVIVLLVWSVLGSAFDWVPSEWPSVFRRDGLWLIPFGAIAGYSAGTLLTGTLLLQSVCRRPRPAEGTQHRRPPANDRRPPLAPTLVSQLAQQRRERGISADAERP